MGIEDQFSHFLILGGAFILVGFKEVLSRPLREIDLLTVFFIGGLAMIIVGLVDRIADHV